MTDDDRTRTVEIPESTAEAISNRLAGTEFESVDDYVTFALDQLLRELEGESERRSLSGGSDDGTTDDAVKDRLESLGYL